MASSSSAEPVCCCFERDWYRCQFSVVIASWFSWFKRPFNRSGWAEFADVSELWWPARADGHGTHLNVTGKCVRWYFFGGIQNNALLSNVTLPNLNWTNGEILIQVFLFAKWQHWTSYFVKNNPVLMEIALPQLSALNCDHLSITVCLSSVVCKRDNCVAHCRVIHSSKCWAVFHCKISACKITTSFRLQFRCRFPCLLSTDQLFTEQWWWYRTAPHN